MYKSKLRLLGMSALVGATALFSGTANAAVINLGQLEVDISAVGSAAVSARVADRETKLLPEVNGGPVDTRAVTNITGGGISGGTADNAAAACSAAGSICTVATNTAENANYDHSINADDSRLNFDSGDLTGGNIKLTTDIMATAGALTFFTRINAFYDGVLASDSSYERTEVDARARDEKYNVEILDAYIDFNFDFFNNPANLRVGKQVINWGESTFFLSGNSIVNPLDVATLVRPGSEIKEALLPVESVYFSTGLSDSLSVEAYYSGHDTFRIPAGGTPFGGGDSFFIGTTNIKGSYIGGGNTAGWGKLNCDTSSGTLNTFATALNTAALAAIAGSGVNCTDTPALGFRHNQKEHFQATGVTPEQQRLDYNDPFIIQRQADNEDVDDSYGIALRYYSEALLSTEFALYAQNYTSRVPIASVTAGRPTVGWGIGAGATTDGTTRGTAVMGCGLLAFNPVYNAMQIDDPYNLLDPTAAHTTALEAQASGSLTSQPGTLARLQEMVCDANLNNAVAIPGVGSLTSTGQTNLSIFPQLGLIAEYPEEIESYGFSFNTTLFGTGVQGEYTYRPSMPMQVDTDALVISSLVSSCLFTGYGGLQGTFEGLASVNAVRGQSCDTSGGHVLSGITEEVLHTWDIGTTTLFNGSNPVISLLGANSGLILTEFTGAYLPDLTTTTFQTTGGPVVVEVAKEGVPLTNYCTSGSELPLKGLFSLDDRRQDECRTTRNSTTGLLLARLTYNNVFGSAFTLEPTVIYRQGLQGRGPGGVHGVGSASLRLDATRQGTTYSFGYVDYIGDVQYNRNIDRDQVSLTMTRSF